VKVAVLTVSDRASAGTYEDGSGPAVEAAVTAADHEVVARDLVPDEIDRIAAALTAWADAGAIDLILTTGGTGLGPRDVTPEATRTVIEREAPGIAEAMRAHGRALTPFAALSRQVAGTRGACLIVNLPGSPKAAVESLDAVLPILGHAVEMLRA
jgi:molybdopterin adenylyltransferase